MGKLVNYGKRNVQLPDGCKDLIDVIRERTAVEHMPPLGNVFARGMKVIREDQATIRITELLPHIADFLDSSASMRVLMMSPPDAIPAIPFLQLKRVLKETSIDISVIDEPARTAAVSEFLMRQKLKFRERSTGPIPFVDGNPSWNIYSISSPPFESLALSNLIELALRDVAGVTTVSPLSICRIDSEPVS